MEKSKRKLVNIKPLPIAIFETENLDNFEVGFKNKKISTSMSDKTARQSN